MIFPRAYAEFRFRNEIAARAAADQLFDSSCWYAVQPEPDGEYVIAVKPEPVPCSLCSEPRRGAHLTNESEPGETAMKPKHWRQYYGYRPQTLAALKRYSDDWVKSLETDYIDWLAETRGWTKEEAEKHARSFPMGGIIAQQEQHDGVARTVEEIDFTELSPRCVVRTVRCWSRTAGEEWTGERWLPFRAQAWCDHLAKPEAPTVYAVVIDGRWVNSFLTKPRAKAWALAEIDRQRAAEPEIREAA